jgi:thioredoxin-dependent peroxiredoxin
MDKAPDFKLSDQDGKQHSLNDYTGKWLVLYFYPKDDTPGCTKEACDFRDNLGALKSLGAEVVGVSADDVDSHGQFASKHGLNFPLLADAGAEVSKAYGAYGTKNMYGNIFEGVMRQTFLIDPDGEIVKAWKRVSVDAHAAEVEIALRDAQAMRAQRAGKPA